MECLITGASGFVGRWLRSALIERGFTVRCFDSRAAGVENELVGDILDRDAMARACEGVGAVYHLVGLQSSRSHGSTT
jgi:nucleoside-diphosphate-sugar epimerase